MSAANTTLLAVAACVAAFGGGVLGMTHVLRQRVQAARKATRMRGLAGRAAPFHREGLEGRVLAFAWQAQMQAGPHAGEQKRVAGSDGKDSQLQRSIRQAGLADHLEPAGVRSTQRRIALVLGVAGCVIGAALSVEMGLLLAGVGLCVGWLAPRWALRRFEKQRSFELERCLPEMLEVVALGLRSGLSFDRSLQLYSTHFPSSFARACSSARQSWSLGLRTREDALRELVKSYQSDQLERTVERIVRSLRFGSALAPDLEAAAAEARSRRRAQVEERVAKAPVKMMVPTGALILPAMLILVLGPILLELMAS